MNELEYLESERLFDKLIQLHYAEELRKGIVKNANDQLGAAGNAILASGDAIADFFKKSIDTTSTASIIESVVRFMTPAALFLIPGVGPWLGILDAIAQSTIGYSLADPLIYIVKNVVLPAFQSGKQVNPADITAVVNSKSSTASLAQVLSPIEKQGFIIMAGTGEGNFTERLIKNAFLGAVAKLLWPVAGFIISTGLKSVGLLGTGAIIGSAIGIEKPKFVASPIPGTTTAPITATTPKHSGKGQEYHANDNVNAWMPPIEGGSIDNTLYNWTVEIYPELKRYKSIILNNDEFVHLVDELDRLSGAETMEMPVRFHTRKEVVDSFIGGVQRDIQELNDEK